MKVFRDNVCYVDYMDLVAYEVPSYFEMEKKFYAKDEMVILDDPKSIFYVESREDIIDYDTVSSLNISELEKLYQKSLELISYYSKRLLGSERNKLYYDLEFMKKYKINKHLADGYLDYMNNREEIDNKIKNNINKNQKILLKRKGDKND